MVTVSDLVQSTIDELIAGVEAAIPRVLQALIVIAVAFVAIRVVLRVVRSVLDRLYPARKGLVVDLGVAIVSTFLWFGVALTVLSILGLTEIAASLGTATGFIALGVSYALSGMIEDTVAGVYLLRDPDFEVGDRVTADGVEGTVRAIELRKSRFELDDGDVTVVANADVESRWTRLEESVAEDTETPAE